MSIDLEINGGESWIFLIFILIKGLWDRLHGNIIFFGIYFPLCRKILNITMELIQAISFSTTFL